MVYNAGVNTVWSVEGAGMNIHNAKRLRFYAITDASQMDIGITYNGVGGGYSLILPYFQGATSSLFMNNGMGGCTWSTTDYLKILMGISGNNFGDVTIGSFLAATSTVGATITAAQVLAFTEAQTTNPGMVSPNAQTWNGAKTFAGAVQLNDYLKFGGASLISIGSSATAGYTLILPTTQGSTFSQLQNDGRGNLSWVQSSGQYTSVSNSGATLAVTDRWVDITTGATNRTLNIAWSTGNTGVMTYITKIDAGLGTVTVQDPNGVNGVTNFSWSSQWETHTFVGTGSGLRVLQ
jgi:hypothetical protein